MAKNQASLIYQGADFKERAQSNADLGRNSSRGSRRKTISKVFTGLPEKHARIDFGGPSLEDGDSG